MKNVFVTIGTHPQDFSRLIKQIDSIASKNKIKFFVQTGYTKFKPENFSSKKFLSDSEYNKKFAKADVIISHGGAGTIIRALELKKSLIIVPRLKKFNEHTNDHQLDLAKALQKRGKALYVANISSLEKTLKKSLSFKPKFSSEKQKLIKAVNSYIKSLK